MTFSRSDIAKYFAVEAGVKVGDANIMTKYFLKAFRDFIMNMRVGDRLEIRGLGVFEMKLYRGRTTSVRDIAHGKEAIMAARRKLRFKPSKILKKSFMKVI